MKLPRMPTLAETMKKIEDRRGYDLLRPRSERDSCAECGGLPYHYKDCAAGRIEKALKDLKEPLDPPDWDPGVRFPGAFPEPTIHPETGSGETRITDPNTGGEKGQKGARLGSLDPFALLEVAYVAGFGEKKYSRLNYMKGYAWSLSYDALQRHLHAFWSGEDRDPESGYMHLAHAAWHCLALIAFSFRKLGTDDRYK